MNNIDIESIKFDTEKAEEFRKNFEKDNEEFSKLTQEELYNMLTEDNYDERDFTQPKSYKKPIINIEEFEGM